MASNAGEGVKKNYKTMDGNEAVASVAYRLNELMVIYPITPSSAMGEWAEQWQSEKVPNLWGEVPSVVEMQSEAGAAGTLHGALQTGSLATTFTASQGLLLMIPNMYKMAGELTPVVIHVASRAIATHALSIFGDHSDAMAVRATGFALLCSASVQEAMDFALISHAATLESRIPFLHFFDGFRTSHEISKIQMLSDQELRSMISEDLILAHRRRGLSPDHPVLRGTAQNPDVFFQSREAVNPYYLACPDIIQKTMDKFAAVTGRQYHLYDYHGAAHPEYLIVMMGSGTETVDETVDFMNTTGWQVGVLKVRLFRPFDVKRFIETMPSSVKAIAVLDRMKEPGAAGEPLYLDCVHAFHEASQNHWKKFHHTPKIFGGRYGLSSKEFTPAMVAAVFANLAASHPKNHFTVGIEDDVTHLSLPYDAQYFVPQKDVFNAIFYGLGSDGTVGANKNSIKIIGESTDLFTQGYFVYDSKKSGAMTISHLRFGPKPIRAPYLIAEANFIACHQWLFLERHDVLENAGKGATFLLNSPYGPEQVWRELPRKLQEEIVDKKIQLYVIDAYKVAAEAGMGGKFNTVMQVCFFAISGVLPREQALNEIKTSIRKTYAKKGEEVIQKNLKAVDQTLANLFQVSIPASLGLREMSPPVSEGAPKFVKDVLGTIIKGSGDQIPVSCFPSDGTYPTGTSKWEKRNLAQEIPVWEPNICIECGKCAMICPHSVIRIKVYDPKVLTLAPASFKSTDARDAAWKGMNYTIQVAPEDCTGCGLCVEICPAQAKNPAQESAGTKGAHGHDGIKEVRPKKALNMEPQPPLREQEKTNWEFFLSISDFPRDLIKTSSIRHQQLQEPLFEFPSACSGCGETPYIKLVSQLFGDRAVIANATGCSSIFGANLPTTPWAKNAEGRGPAWSNSLFEDNAEFGYGFRLSLDQQKEAAAGLLKKMAAKIGEDLVKEILNASQNSEAEIYAQRHRIEKLKERISALEESQDLLRLKSLADMLVKKSVWIIGGDGWAYDIGFGGLDHVLASGRNVNILVLDTEVYSNTGGQASKSTPRAAVAKFASAGKHSAKKDLGLMAMTYGNVYVASVAMGAKDEHTLKAFLEAEAYPGPSLIIAYSHCMAHGIDMRQALTDQKAAVDSGRWLLYRFHPDRVQQGLNPLVLDSREPTLPVEKYLQMENRFKVLTKTNPEEAAKLFHELEEDIKIRWALYQSMAHRNGKT